MSDQKEIGTTALVKYSLIYRLGHFIRHLLGQSCNTYVFGERHQGLLTLNFCLEHKLRQGGPLQVHTVQWDWTLTPDQARQIISDLENFVALHDGLKKR